MPHRKKNKLRKILMLISKVALSILLIFFVFTKIDPDRVFSQVKELNWFILSGGVVAVLIAQIMGAMRMRFNFKTNGIEFSKLYSTSFYFIGTFFNIVLPGGIGGDGYKAYYFQKRFRFPWQRTTLVVIRGRASGLLMLCVFFLALSYTHLDRLPIPHAEEFIILGSIIIFPCYSFLAKKLLKEPLEAQIGAIKYSFCVQILYLIAITFILYSMNIVTFDSLVGYIMVFLLANIVAVIPISFGGLGLRELTYVVLSSKFGLSTDLGVAASMLFYLVYSGVALLGIIPYLAIHKLDIRELNLIRKTKYYYENIKPYRHLENGNLEGEISEEKALENGDNFLENKV